MLFKYNNDLYVYVYIKTLLHKSNLSINMPFLKCEKMFFWLDEYCLKNRTYRRVRSIHTESGSASLDYCILRSHI